MPEARGSMYKGLNVLVVDDNSLTRRIVTTLAKNMGFGCITEAENGVLAWNLLQENSYDILLCDYNMPEMNGLELLIRLRNDPRFKTMPFMMITALDDKDNIVNILKAGVSQYLVKPFRHQVFREKIHKIFEQN